MSLAELRVLLLGASLGEGAVPEFARLAIATWGSQAETADGARRGPMSGAERSRKWRDERRRKRDEDRNAGVTKRNAGATENVTERDAAVADPSRALPSPSGSSLSSPSKPGDPSASIGSTGARASDGAAAARAETGPLESGTFKLETTDAQRDPQRSVTKTATKRDGAQRNGTSGRIALDWQPPRELRGELETRGIDVAKVRDEFVEFWDDEADLRKRKAFKSARGWVRTFKNRVDDLVARGTVPMLGGRPRQANGHWSDEEPSRAQQGAARDREAETRRAIEGR